MSTSLGVTGSGGGSPRAAVPEGAEKATVGAGCFWGVEHLYRKHFGDKGLYDARVGYTGGDATNPNYKQVCSGKTGRKSFFISSPSLSLTLLPAGASHVPIIRVNRSRDTQADGILQTTRRC